MNRELHSYGQCWGFDCGNGGYGVRVSNGEKSGTTVTEQQERKRERKKEKRKRKDKVLQSCLYMYVTSCMFNKNDKMKYIMLNFIFNSKYKGH